MMELDVPCKPEEGLLHSEHGQVEDCQDWQENICLELRIEIREGFDRLSAQIRQQLQNLIPENTIPEKTVPENRSRLDLNVLLETNGELPTEASPDLDWAGNRQGGASAVSVDKVAGLEKSDNPRLSIGTRSSRSLENLKPWRGWMESLIENTEGSRTKIWGTVFEDFRLRHSQRDDCFAKIVHSRVFSFASMFIICVNAIWIGWECNNAFGPPIRWHSKVDQVFTTIFILELLVRIIALRRQFIVGDDYPWNLFDFMIVLTCIPEYVSTSFKASYLRLIRLAKLSRVFRLARLFKLFSSIHEILVTIAFTMGSLFWCFTALLLVTYCFALLIMQAMSGHLDEGEQFNAETMASFGSTFNTMLTLFSIISGGLEWYAFGQDFKQHSAWLVLMSLVFYVFFMIFGLFNVITGVFCARASEASLDSDDVRVATEESKRAKKVHGLLQIFKMIDEERSGYVNWEQFHNFTTCNHRARTMLQSHGLQLFDLDKVWHAMDSYDGTADGLVDRASFVMGIMRLSEEGICTNIFSLTVKVDCLCSDIKSLFQFMGANPPPSRGSQRNGNGSLVDHQAWQKSGSKWSL